MDTLPWFKLYGGEYLSDSKILELSAAERSCWVTLLCYASSGNGKVSYLSEEKLMLQAGVNPLKEEWNETKGVLMHFKKLKMIRLNKTFISIMNWSKRQERAMTGYERVKKYRENRDNDMITESNGNDNPRVDKKRVEKSREDNKDTFEKFWSSYPKKKAKKTAEKSWGKISPSEHEVIFRVLPIHAAQEDWRKDKGKFIPFPASWLNQERWKDEIQQTNVMPTVKPKCKNCGGESATWVQVQGGRVCGVCWVKTNTPKAKENQEKINAMKSEMFKSMPSAK